MIIIHLAFIEATIDRIIEIIIHNDNNTLSFHRGDY